mmetsp:Transcript_25546/g.64934  ORF Transcript_25546/g.64934 Transcript_25546/m.64934 type:complete len:396 (+) Transcript_25546:92-1279(+)
MLLSEPRQDASSSERKEIIVWLSRTESGLGLHFDAFNVVTKLLPGCAAEQHGGVRVGDVLTAVNSVRVHPGDHIGAMFPMEANEFELLLLRRNRMYGGTEEGSNGTDSTCQNDIPRSSSISSHHPQHLGHSERIRLRRELSGKHEDLRLAPVFQEVVWNEYCVLFPDGSSAPFNEAVRYTAFTGYLRKKRLKTEGRAEFALAQGESQRGWARHFFHLSMKQLAWFDEDPQGVLERRQRVKGATNWRTWLLEATASFKQDRSTGKSVGSALLYTAPCRLYTSRLYRNEFALSFGQGQLLIMQAANGKDAQLWLVAIASCLYFSSASFEAVLAGCRRFFDAANKTIDGKLSPIEALDLVRAMGRTTTFSQVMRAAEAVAPEGGWFGPREFAYLVCAP